MRPRGAPVAVAACCAALLAVLAALVASGALSGLDQWSVDHLMPGLGPASSGSSALNSAFPIFDPGKQHGHEVAAAVTYAVVWVASAIPATVLVAATVGILWRRNRTVPAVALAGALVAANVLEVLGKHVIGRPTLIDHFASQTFRVVPFDHSFPSGHEIRAVVLMGCVVAVAPKLAPLAACWLAAVTVTLVTGGWHTPTDVAGGFLVGVGTLAGVLVVTRSFLRGPRSAM